MYKFLHSLLILLLISGVSFAQVDLDLTEYSSVKDLESEFEDFNNGIHAGMSVLDWTDASGPSVFRFSAGVFFGVGSIEKNEAIGIDDDLYFPGGAGIQLGFGTAGFEAYGRFLPELEMSGANVKVLGFGLKYEITDLIPVPAFPATALFADYNTMTFGATETNSVTVQGVTGDVKTGINLDFSTINIGAMMSYDLVVARIYGKLGVELGSTDMTWNQAIVTNGVVVPNEITGTLDSTGFRFAAGLALFGFKVEVGGRGSNLAAGVGYGISI
ncbi:MAG: hypothetical protein D8M58_02515 [Calditrichaeota bacterium]|nr:MAG: hypothetical protein DWQ03_04565 [Calditrichota bacterium]MBL1204236.1 hypothetical protein [Calditrichota bacterium]NOG44066.1 hypothetical protein [Calditrichota bacterium]